MPDFITVCAESSGHRRMVVNLDSLLFAVPGAIPGLTILHFQGGEAMRINETYESFCNRILPERNHA